MNGKQSGDAAELAHAVVDRLAHPRRNDSSPAKGGVDSVARKAMPSLTRWRRTGGCPPASKRSIWPGQALHHPSWASIDRVPRREHLSHIT